MRALSKTAVTISVGVLLTGCGSNPPPQHETPALVAVDTTPPPAPETPNLPVDSTYTVEAPNLPRAECLYYRNIVGIVFDDTTSGTRIQQILSTYAGTITGGNPADDEYIVSIPDPGPTFAAIESIVTQLYAEPGVALARKVYYRTPTYSNGAILRGTDTTQLVPLRGTLVSGRVMDTQFEHPVNRAIVRMPGTSFDAETDSTGRFTISAIVTPGCHRLTVRAIGYGWTEVRFTTSGTTPTTLGDVPIRGAPIPEWRLLLVNNCDAGPLTADEAPWGVDTVTSH